MGGAVGRKVSSPRTAAAQGREAAQRLNVDLNWKRLGRAMLR